MEESQTSENYPFWIVALSNLLSLSIYVIGVYILAGISIWLAVPYLLYCLTLEVWALR